ncbi:MAG: bifunctional DNA-formamidopyrimidine glycosylase/DNA-(apurinic or apyrimidinic site) lyase [Acidobacteriaceae bacterium]|nr:bifunctional DNA-formamidopyrimidine glycosylase/DNA-(apurinic or apyrimidinic site) lyase [Acidobacteriaceae bacterium]
MPELPEVETVIRSLVPHIRGRTIVRAELSSRRVTRGDWAATEAALTDATITGVRRRGKQIFIDLNRGILYVHLGMTGKLLWNADPGKYTRARLELDSGTLLFDDIRQFGRFEYLPEEPGAKKGPDALGVDFATFHSRIQRYRGSIKAVFLNQAFVSGVGNIYADEILFAARVHPKTAVARISKRRAEIIHKHMLGVLEQAIELRGSSISDYVDSAGLAGEFQTVHRVYARTGQPCTVCGTPIRRIVIGQRGTHYCPRCQRA